MVGHGEKITFGEMRAAGVTAVIVYCSDFKCSHHAVVTAEQCRITFGCPILSRNSSARCAARKALRFDRTAKDRDWGKRSSKMTDNPNHLTATSHCATSDVKPLA